jgi:hypothetical protein
MIKVVLELHRAEAMALAQLCKRFTYDDAEGFANRHDGGREREAILDGIRVLEKALVPLTHKPESVRRI